MPSMRLRTRLPSLSGVDPVWLPWLGGGAPPAVSPAPPTDDAGVDATGMGCDASGLLPLWWLPDTLWASAPPAPPDAATWAVAVAPPSARLLPLPWAEGLLLPLLLPPPRLEPALARPLEEACLGSAPSGAGSTHFKLNCGAEGLAGA